MAPTHLTVYAWGKNSQGELGTGALKDMLDPSTIEFFPSPITSIGCGDHHALACTELGDLYAWGRGREGQLGNGEVHYYSHTPQRVATIENERVVQVGGGSKHCIAITAEGNLYIWGMLHRYQEETEYFGGKIQMVGMGATSSQKNDKDEDDDWVVYRRRMLEKSTMDYLFAGVDRSGLDSGKKGDRVTSEITNFGNFSPYKQTTPKLISAMDDEGNRVKFVCADGGYSFTVAVSDMGLVYSWGFNEKRQLGIGHRFNQEQPQLLATLAANGVKVKKVSCGLNHVLALTEDGDVWSWGMGNFGQLGHGVCHDEGIPRKIDSLDEEEIVDIACGSYHSVCVTSAGKVYSWGSSEYGQQGARNKHTDWNLGITQKDNLGEREYYYSQPREVSTTSLIDEKVVSVTCGSLHNVLSTDKGSVYTYGWGSEGALGHGNRRFQHAPRKIARLRGEKLGMIFAGGRSTYAITSDGTMNFAFDFKPLVNSKSYCDITFTIKNREVRAHRAVVQGRCRKLSELINTLENVTATESEDEKQGQASEDKIEIDADYFAFVGLLRYLYTDHLTAAPHHIGSIGELARRFELPRLAALCDRFLVIDSAPVVHGDSAATTEAPAIPPSNFVEEMGTLVDNSQFADVTFILDDGSRISAHKPLLASRSDYFVTIFEGSFSEAGASEISLHDVSSDTFLSLLRYIYTNDHLHLFNDDSKVDLVDALLCSSRFLASTLTQKIEKELEGQLDLSNCLNLYTISVAANTPKLKRAALVVAAKDYDELVESDSYCDMRDSNPLTIRQIADQVNRLRGDGIVA